MGCNKSKPEKSVTGSSRKINNKIRDSKTSDFSKPTIIFIIGPPSCGKTTQCKLLADRFDYKYLSST